MDRFKPKLKKEKQSKESKESGKDKYPQIITDVKSIKENLKIKEILRTVKMNNSMRLKAPPGSKVMSNKDFNEEDCFESSINQEVCDPLCATNPDVIISKTDQEENNESPNNTVTQESIKICENGFENNFITEESETHHMEQIELNNSIDNKETRTDNHQSDDAIVKLNLPLSNGGAIEKNRDRKLSLDHTILTRQDGLSQSELELNSIGKSPLERKSSFFRKKMDSFVRNTSEMFRRQNKSLKRRVSMSLSLQSLNENTSDSNDEVKTNTDSQQESLGSRTSLQIASPMMRSTSSLSLRQSGQPSSPSPQSSLAGSQSTIYSGSNLEHSNSIHSLNEVYLKEAMLYSRAISMSSGLDSTYGLPSRKASRSNRVTWIASEGLTNYLRRKIQDEKSKEMQACQSYQDFSSIPENELYNRKPDTKGRRLSYQRAVSGEDPVLPTKYQDSTLRRKHQMSEPNEAHCELSSILAEFSRHGVPTLNGFDVADIPEESLAYLLWATKQSNIEDVFNWKSLTSEEEARQAAIRELIHTEAEHIKHLLAIVEVFIAAAHAIQDRGKMLGIDTSRVFANFPDLLNASLQFWHISFIPMIKEAVLNKTFFNSDLMSYGFLCFHEIFEPYEKFLIVQRKIIEYYRSQQSDAEFSMYLAWCHSQKACNRLQFNDFIVKPMQRLTKYSLILQRIGNHTHVQEVRLSLENMENSTRKFLVEVNLSVRQHEEMEKLHEAETALCSYDPNMRDEEVVKVYKMYAQPNLHAPMLYCLPNHSRNLIHTVDLRFRDGVKEIEVRIFLLTDMLLVSRKFGKGNQYLLIRPKYMIDKMIQIVKLDKNNRDITGLAYVMLDDVGSSYTSFVLSETSKDPNPQNTLRMFQHKVKEAKLTYELLVWIARNPDRELSMQDVNTIAEHTNTKSRFPGEDGLIENEAFERITTVLHRNGGPETNRNLSTLSFITDSVDTSASPHNHTIVGLSTRQLVAGKKFNVMHRTFKVLSPRTTQNSGHSSLEKSTSAQSHDDPDDPSRLLHRPSTSTEHHHHHLPTVPDPNEGSPSITFTDSEIVPTLQIPTLKIPPLNTVAETDSSSNARNTLRVQTQNNVATMIYTLPHLTVEPCTPRTTTSPTHLTASEKMYQSHQEIIEKHRQSSSNQQYLSPDNRGSSYPPPSPTRSLKRGFAFSYTIKNPPLSKMGHVGSQSHTQVDTIGSSPVKDERVVSPRPEHSKDKADKKSKLASSRRKRKDKSQEGNVETCSSRKDENSDLSYKDHSPDLYRREESSCSSYKDESPEKSYRCESISPSHRDVSPLPSYGGESPSRYSPQPSARDESVSPCHKDENLDDEKTSASTSRRDSTMIKSDTTDSNVKGEFADSTSRRESKSSDYIQKEKSLSFSFEEESFSFSHKDDTPSVERKEKTPSPASKIEKIEILEESLDTKEDELTTINASQFQESHGSSKDDLNKNEIPGLSHKTKSSNVLNKQDDDSLYTNRKKIYPSCEKICQETIEQETEESTRQFQPIVDTDPTRKVEEPCPSASQKCDFTSSSSSSPNEELGSSTSRGTDAGSSIKYEMFRSSTLSSYAQEVQGLSAKHEPVTSQNSVQELLDTKKEEVTTIDSSQTQDSHDSSKDGLNKEKSPDLSHKTKPSNVIYKQDDDNLDTNRKKICPSCEKTCQETIEQETEDSTRQFQSTLDTDPTRKIEEPCPSVSQKCEFTSSSSSSTHEELCSTTSNGTDAGPSIKYEMICSSTPSSYAQEAPGLSGRHEPVTSQDSVQELEDPELSDSGDGASSSSRDEKSI